MFPVKQGFSRAIFSVRKNKKHKSANEKNKKIYTFFMLLTINIKIILWVLNKRLQDNLCLPYDNYYQKVLNLCLKCILSNFILSQFEINFIKKFGMKRNDSK